MSISGLPKEAILIVFDHDIIVPLNEPQHPRRSLCLSEIDYYDGRISPVNNPEVKMIDTSTNVLHS